VLIIIAHFPILLLHPQPSKIIPRHPESANHLNSDEIFRELTIYRWCADSGCLGGGEGGFQGSRVEQQNRIRESRATKSENQLISRDISRINNL